MVNSTYEFIRLSQTINSPKMLASLDVESLFTNVPVIETIKIICDAAYNHPDIAPPRIPRDALEQLLYICTTKTPFKTPWGDLYAQTNGVSMGTPLGPTFANFYASWLENKVFTENPTITPKVYCRYMDDIFVVIEKFEELKILQTTFENNSVLKFTYEIEQKKEIPFLDVLISRNADNVTTSVFKKPTDTGECLNYDSICPERYKINVIKNFLHRSHKICSTWELFMYEVDRIKQMLINNNFPNAVVDLQIRKFIAKKRPHNSQPNEQVPAEESSMEEK